MLQFGTKKNVRGTSFQRRRLIRGLGKYLHTPYSEMAPSRAVIYSGLLSCARFLSCDRPTGRKRVCTGDRKAGASETARTCTGRGGGGREGPGPRDVRYITQTPGPRSFVGAFSTVFERPAPGPRVHWHRGYIDVIPDANASVSVLRFYYSSPTTCYASRPFIKYNCVQVYRVSFESPAVKEVTKITKSTRSKELSNWPEFNFYCRASFSVVLSLLPLAKCILTDCKLKFLQNFVRVRLVTLFKLYEIVLFSYGNIN